MRKRLLSIAMALCMVLTLLPATAFADENPETPVCTCEEACTAETMNTECAVCGAEGAAVESCCKYAAPAKDEPEEPVEQPEAPTCVCKEACTAEAMNTECAVCGAEGASVESCCKYVAPAKEGTDPEPELTAVEKVQAMIDALPTVEDLEDAEDEKVDEVYAALQDVYDALDELSTEELDQLTGLDKLAALMEWFTGPVSTFTGATDEKYFNFDKSTGMIISLTSEGKKLTEIVIPETIDGYNVISIGANVFANPNLKSVTIPSSVTSIGNSAFHNCTSLESVTFNANSQLKSIGERTFFTCINLKSITIPDSVTYIGKEAFSDCTGLESVTFGKDSQLTSIGNSAFSDCTSLTGINIPNGVTSIGNNAFYNCTGLTSIEIPSSVTSIGTSAFWGCKKLTNINIPNGVTSIENNTFYGCEKLTSLEIPNSVTSIGTSAFRSCEKLTNINIPNGVTSIGNSAFCFCTSLTNISIPNGVTSIKDSAFSNCTSLTNINIPNGVTSIEKSAFNKCERLKNIEIPSSVTSIDFMAFSDCTSLESIFLPDNDNLTINSNAIPGTVTQVRYSLDAERGEVTITGIDKTEVAIPATICGYPVVAAVDGLSGMITSHTCAGGEATCQTKAICGICKHEIGDYADHTLTKIEAKDPTCTEDGNIEYWKCSVCLELFSDNKGTNETTFEAVTIKATGHTLIKTDAKDPTCTEDGNTAYWTCSVCHKLFSDEDGKTETTLEAVTMKATGHTLTKTDARAATVTETGNIEYWQCKDCGNLFSDPDGKNKIELEDTVTAKLPPEIIKGKGQSVAEGEKKALAFTSNAAFDDFIRVELDGKTLDAKNYTVKEGSTIVALKADYVATLSAGKHTIGIVSESGTATTTFTVKEKTAADNDTKAPETGDTSRMALWIALLLISGGLLTVMEICGKKKKYNR